MQKAELIGGLGLMLLGIGLPLLGVSGPLVGAFLTVGGLVLCIISCREWIFGGEPIELPRLIANLPAETGSNGPYKCN